MVVGRCIDDSGCEVLRQRWAILSNMERAGYRVGFAVVVWSWFRPGRGISAAISAFIWYNLAFLEDGRLMMRGLPKVGGEVASGVGRLCGVKGHGRRPDEARELSGKRETRR